MYGEFDPTITYTFNELETAIVMYKGAPYILTGVHTAGVAPDSVEGAKIWKQMSKEEGLYARYIHADKATIGDMSLINGEGDDDYLAFDHKFEADGELERYMQIGGSLPDEGDLLSEAVHYETYDLLRGPYTKTSAGTYTIDVFNSAEDARSIDYQANGSVSARAERTWKDLGGVEGFWEGQVSTITAYIRVVVNDASNREV